MAAAERLVGGVGELLHGGATGDVVLDGNGAHAVLLNGGDGAGSGVPATRRWSAPMLEKSRASAAMPSWSSIRPAEPGGGMDPLPFE